MKAQPSPATTLGRAAAGLVACLLVGCGGSGNGATAPASPQAVRIDDLWDLSLWLGIAVWGMVMVLLAVPVVRSWRRRPRRRRADEVATDGHDPDDRGAGGQAPDDRRVGGRDPGADAGRSAWTSPPGAALDEPLATADPSLSDAAQQDRQVRGRLLWLGGIVVPAIILVGLLIASGRVGVATAHVDHPDDLVVEVTGHMFWWEVHYPQYDVTTANEIHVPVDEPVRLRLTTGDVIHSFWIPRLHGKIDMVPGQENWLTFEATERGRFRGACAEFCGISHAQMVPWVQVQETEAFEAWIDDQAADAAPPTSDAAQTGQEVFLGAGCAGCHAVRGHEASSELAPDLTHLADRKTLAAGIVENDPNNLEQLILAPQSIKPGIRMPSTDLDADEIDALVAYLGELE